MKFINKALETMNLCLQLLNDNEIKIFSNNSLTSH